MPAATAWLRENFIVDGVDYGSHDINLDFLGDSSMYPATMLFEKVSFGETQYDSFNPEDFDLRNISVGSTGFGSSDIWAPVFTTTVVPPFDSYFGTPGDMTVSGGVITVANAGSLSYGLHEFATNRRELYLQFDLRVRPVNVADGVFTSPYFSLWNQLGNECSGVYNQHFFTTRDWVANYGSFGAGPVANVWTTIQYHVQIIGGQDGIVFDGMPAFKVAS